MRSLVEGRGPGVTLVGSEKSPIVTLRWCVGLGGLIENVLTRTVFSHRTGGWDLSHLQEIAVFVGHRSPRCAAGVRRLAQTEPFGALPRPGRFARQAARAVSA